MTDVRNSHWAQGERDSYQRLADAVPAALETAFEQWQGRADNNKSEEVFPFGLARTFIVTATLYEYKDGQTKPTEPTQTKTFIVVADYMKDAFNRIWAEIGHDWCLNATHGPVLAKSRA